MSSIVPSSEISVILQGPLWTLPKSNKHFGVEQSLPSIKRNFPDAEIIISTWTHENTDGIEVDKIIKSEDPLPFEDSTKTTRNFNRQIVSTKAGLAHATRPYVLKTRSDILFTSPEVAQIDDSRKGSFLKSPITTTNMIVRNHRCVPFLFHPSDVIQFGLKEDMIDLWDIPLETKEEVTSSGRENIFFRYSSTVFRYHPEQSLCIRWLRKHGVDVSLKTPTHISAEYLKTWENTLVNNFHVIDYEKSGIKFPVHFYNAAYGVRSLMTSQELRSIYKDVQKKGSSSKYWIVWVQKYFGGFFKKVFYMAVIANVLSVVAPNLRMKIFAIYRRIRPR